MPLSPTSWGTGSGSPSGPAGGDLDGTYPNPGIGAGKVVSADLATAMVNRDGIRRAGVNVLAEPFSLLVTGNQSVLATQTIYAVAVGLRAGDVVTNMLAHVSIAGAGTAPALIRQGVADASGVMLAVTADSKASAQWTTSQVASVALAPALTITADGLYYFCIVQNGAFGTTAMQHSIQTISGQKTAVAGGVLAAGNQSGQADLPTVGNPLVLSANNSRAFWLAAN